MLDKLAGSVEFNHSTHPSNVADVYNGQRQEPLFETASAAPGLSPIGKKTPLARNTSSKAIIASGLDHSISEGSAFVTTQLAAQAVVSDASQQVVAEEIIVKGTDLNRSINTSLLGEISVADTPFSVAVLTGDLIDNVQARRLTDIIRRDPSVTVTTGVADFRNGQSIRGFPASDQYYDGLGPTQLIVAGPLNAFEQIEVIKGPSSG